MNSRATIELDYCAVLHETAKARLIEFYEGKEVWVPKSTSEIDEDALSIRLPEWMAYEEGLI